MKTIFLFAGILTNILVFGRASQTDTDTSGSLKTTKHAHHKTPAVSDTDDVIYLKNGTVVHGVIMEEIPKVSYKIETADHRMLEYTRDEVSKITYASRKVPEPNKPAKQVKQTTKQRSATASFVLDTAKRKGPAAVFEWGGLLCPAANTNGATFFTYKFSLGKQFNPYVFFGGGFGVDAHGMENLPNHQTYNGEMLLPTFVECRTTPLKKRVSPLIGQQVGYGFYFASPSEAEKNTVNGGLMLQTQVGIRVLMNKRSSFNISLGYRFQQIVEHENLIFGGDAPDGLANYGSLPVLAYPVNSHYTSYSMEHYVTFTTGFSF